MDLIAEGIKQKLIRLEDDGKYIVYLHQEKRRNFSNPEEKVQAESFLSLVLIYKYPVKRIRQFIAVQMGSETKEADIIVYDDDALKSPHIVAECKKPDASELEFRRAADQAVSYAVADGARYVWVTSKLKNEYFEIPAKKPKNRITIPDVPQFGVTELARFKYAAGGGTTKSGQKLFQLELVTQDELTRRFQQAHQALWGGGELNPSEAFDELDKLIFCKLWDERKLVSRKKLRSLDIKESDLLIEKSGGSIDQPVGRVAILRPEHLSLRPIGYSNFILKIRAVAAIVEPLFLYYWLRTSHRIGITESMQAQTNGLRNLIVDEYLEQEIPVPSRELQEKIVARLAQISDEAQTLRDKARIDLATTKREIEDLILGKESND